MVLLALLALLFSLQSPPAGAPDPAQARQQRQELEARERSARLAKLDKEWKSFEVAPFLVLSERQDALARQAAADSVILWKWMGETFPTFAPESYAPTPILCVHSDEDGAGSDGYVEGGYVFAGEGPYVLSIYPAPFLASNVRRRVAEAWFQAKDRDLYFALPGWMRAGLVEVLADARTKGGRLILKPDTDTLNDFAGLMREDKLIPLRKFLKQPLARAASEGEGRDRRFSPSPQAGQFVRYLLAGKGAKGAKTSKILPDTLAALSGKLPALASEVDAALKEAGVSAGAPEWSERRAREFEKLEARVVPEVFEAVFADWTDKDWDALIEGYKFDKF